MINILTTERRYMQYLYHWHSIFSSQALLKSPKSHTGRRIINYVSIHNESRLPQVTQSKVVMLCYSKEGHPFLVVSGIYILS